MDSSLMNESAWTYFSGNDGSKSEYFRNHYWPVYLLFGILAMGALCNMFLIWLINTRMDLAHVIKGLLNIECMFRFLGCVLINSLRGAFILWGWQPSFLIWAVGYMDWITSDFRARELACGSLNESSCPHGLDTLNRTSKPGIENSSRDLNLKSANVATQLYIDFQSPSIRSICSLPSTLAVFSNYGISIFVLLTGVIRYIYVKTEQLGNQTGILNSSCLTYVIIIFGLGLSFSHWVCIWYFIPIVRFRYYQACMWPNNTYQQLLESQGLFAVIMAPLTVYNILIVLVYATLFWYLYKEEQNTRVVELQRPTDNEEVVKIDRMINSEPPRKHKFTAGFGLAHFTTMIVISLMHSLLASYSNMSNSTQTYWILVTMSLLHGIFAPLMVIWSSSDARNQSMCILRNTVSIILMKNSNVISACRTEGIQSSNRVPGIDCHAPETRSKFKTGPSRRNLQIASHKSQNRVDAPIPKIQNYFEDSRSTCGTQIHDNNKNRFKSEDETKRKKYETNSFWHCNSLPRQLSRINLRDYKQIYNNSGDLGLRTLRLLTFNHLMNEKCRKESIPKSGYGLQAEIVESSDERRRSSLNAYWTIKKLESKASKNETRRSSAPNHIFDLDVKSSSYLTKASNTKEKRFNMLNENSYNNYCGLLNYFLNHQSSNRSNRREISKNDLVASVKTAAKPETSRNFVNEQIAYSSNVIAAKSNMGTNVSPSLSLSEIVLSANSIAYNGLEYPDPTNLMRHSFEASLPPPSDALEFDMKSLGIK